MGTVVQVIEAPGGYSVGSLVPELFVPAGTTQPPCWAFTNPGTNIAVKFPLRAINYASGNVAIDIDWYSTAGSTTGTVTWLVSVTSVAAGAAESIEAATGGTQLSIVSTVNATAKGLTRATGSVLSANLDGMATGSDVWIEVQRSTGDTSLSGTAALKAITISYSDGLTGTPGSGDVVGPASSTSLNVPRFADATGKLLSDSGIPASNLVRYSSTSTNTAIVKWNGTAGQVVNDSGVLIDASNNVTGMGTLNTRTIANWADGPGSSTTGNVASFNGSTGKLLQDSGKLASDLVTGPASVTTGRVASFNGTTGKIIQDAGVLASALAQGPGSSTSGNIASWNGTGGLVLQDSGVSATAHAARHNPGGADPLFTGTWSANDIPQWSGSAWTPKLSGETVSLSSVVTVTGASPAANTLADITGLTMSLPRAGTYHFQATGVVIGTGTAAAHWCAMNFTGTVTSIAAHGNIQTAGAGASFILLTQTANNALVSTTAGATGNSTQGLYFQGIIVVSTSGTLSLRHARATTAVTDAWQIGTGFTVWES